MLSTAQIIRAYALMLLALLHTAEAFIHPPTVTLRARATVRMSTINQPDSADARGEPDDDEPGCVVPLRSWRLERARLTEQHSQSVLRRKPAYLPYTGASAFAMTLGLSSKDEWEEWLELGEGRTPYCPRDPEAHYRSKGAWMSWKAFLTGEP